MIRTALLIIVAILAALLAGGFLGSVIKETPGYVLITVGSWSIETSLWVGIALAIVAYFVIRLLFWFVGWLLGLGGQYAGWRSRRRTRAARRQTASGMLAMAEGDWERSRKLLIGAVRDTDAPMINFLNAARVAHKAGDARQADEYLRQAAELPDGSVKALRLTEAELHIDRGDWAEALTSLEVVRDVEPKNRLALQMQLRAMQAAGDWDGVIGILPTLRKVGTLTAEEASSLEISAWAQRLMQPEVEVLASVEAADADAIGAEEEPASGSAAEVVPPVAEDGLKAAAKLFGDIPRKLRQQPELVLAYAQRLVREGGADEAEQLVRTHLKKHWSAPLVAQYAAIRSDAAKQLQTAKDWLKKHPGEPVLLLSMGRLAVAAEQWDEAREYLGQAAALQPRADVQADLGRLLAGLGEVQPALAALDEAVAQVPGASQDLSFPSTAAGPTEEVVVADETEAVDNARA